MSFLLTGLARDTRTTKTLTYSYVGALLALVAWLDTTAAGGSVLAWIHSVPFLDKVIHFVAVGGLAFLLNLVWPRARVVVGPLQMPRGTAVAICVAAVEELSQLLFAGRIFSIGDLTCNVAGAVSLGRITARVHESTPIIPN